MIEAPVRESFEFEADTARLLHLMVHALYTQKEIFLRELISNASDALDRFRFEAIQHPEWLTPDPVSSNAAAAVRPLEIRLEVDRQQRTLTVRDNGIGMRKEEVLEYLGTIARSMSQRLTQGRTDETAPADVPALIGQFGVGFYSSLMVADRVIVVTRHPAEPEGVRWECTAGSSRYTIEAAEEAARGTAVTLFLKPADADAGLEDYLDEWVLRRLVKRHSDFIAHPIRLHDPNGPGVSAPAEPGIDAEAPLNSMQPIWTRSASEVTEDEYEEFYKHIAHDWKAPLLRLAARAEGRHEYHALVFVPSAAPSDLYYHAAAAGLQLYAQRVLVMEQCADLLPRYLRFVKGIVDSADIPLHISRQALQEHRHILQIQRWLTRKILDLLAELQAKDSSTYLAFWQEFGRAFKEGVSNDYDNRERLLSLLLFESSNHAEALTALDGYVARMQPDQQEIYYLTGPSRDVIERSPQLEAFRQKNYEVLYLSDPVDELVVQCVSEYAGKRLRSVLKGKPLLGNEQERQERETELQEQTEAFAPLLNTFARVLESDVRAVRLSQRLVDTPVCLACDEADDSPWLEHLLLRGKGGGARQRRILELNPRHPVIQHLLAQASHDPSAPAIARSGRLLYGHAVLASGSELPDPVAFTRALTEVLEEQIT